jgi:hypothetical protein
VRPILDGTLPLFYPTYFGDGDYDTDLEPQRQPSFVIVQQPPQTIVLPQPGGQPGTRDVAAADGHSPSAPDAQAQERPVPDIGQFILMRRDGQVLMVAAFTITAGQLTYVTREGTRRSFPVGELDVEATRQMNEANGTSVKLTG